MLVDCAATGMRRHVTHQTVTDIGTTRGIGRHELPASRDHAVTLRKPTLKRATGPLGGDPVVPIDGSRDACDSALSEALIMHALMVRVPPRKPIRVRCYLQVFAE